VKNMVPEFFRRLSPKHQLRVAWARVACLALGLAGATHAQLTGERLVRVTQISQITDAVMISNVAVGGRTIECGLWIKPPLVIQPFIPFEAGGDWLQQMTISLINRTNKTVVFGRVIFHFMDAGDCSSARPCPEALLEVGQIPAIDAYDGRTGQPMRRVHPERPALDWGPEQTIVVHVSDYMPEIEASLANFLPVSAVTKVNVYRGDFYFADGMQWNLGRYSAPDLDHPGKFKPLAADYFPGKRGRNWPPGYNQ
jgi:hypothetical protein